MRELTKTELSAVSGGDVGVTASGPGVQAIVDIIFLPVAIVVGLLEAAWNWLTRR